MGIDLALFIGRSFVEIGWLDQGCAVTRRCALDGPVSDCVVALMVDSRLCLKSIDSVLIGTSLADDNLVDGHVSRTALVESNATSRQAHDAGHTTDRLVIPNELRLSVDEPGDYDGCAGAFSDSEIGRIASELDHLEIDSVAICLSSAESQHGNEVALAKALQSRHPCMPVFLSCLSEVSRAPIKRLETVCGDALLSPVLAETFIPLLREMRRLELPEPIVLDGRGREVTLAECMNRAGVLRGSQYACLSFASSRMAAAAGDRAILALAWTTSASQAWSVAGDGTYMAHQLVANAGPRLSLKRTSEGVVIRDERDWRLRSASILNRDDEIYDLARRIENDLGCDQSSYNAMVVDEAVNHDVAEAIARQLGIREIALFPRDVQCLGLIVKAASRSQGPASANAGLSLDALNVAWQTVDQRS